MTNYCIRWRGIFKGLSEDGGYAKFSENLRAIPFKKDLSNETTLAWSISMDSTFNLNISDLCNTRCDGAVLGTIGG